MKQHLSRIILAILLTLIPTIQGTNAFFTDTAVVEGSTISTGCWVPPSTPELINPLYDKTFSIDDPWLDNPLFDWTDAETTCPGASVKYQLSLYTDSGLTQIYTRSTWLTISQLSVINIPDGTYYWQVIAKDSEEQVSLPSSVWTFTIDRSPRVKPGDVIINEVMWMGSVGHNEDEWIELKNTTDRDINISQWTLENSAEKLPKTGNRPVIHLNGNVSIPAHGYYLLTKKNPTSNVSSLAVDSDEIIGSLSLYNQNNGPLILRSQAGLEIDRVETDPQWPAGCNTDDDCSGRRSMQRDNHNLSLWHDCNVDACKSLSFWKTEADNYGTPGAENQYTTGTQMSINYNHETFTTTITLTGEQLNQFNQSNYRVEYLDNGVSKEITDTFSIPSTHKKQTKIDLVLGTKSDEVWVHPTKVEHIKVFVMLYNGVIERQLTDELAL